MKIFDFLYVGMNAAHISFVLVIFGLFVIAFYFKDAGTVKQYPVKNATKETSEEKQN